MTIDIDDLGAPAGQRVAQGEQLVLATLIGGVGNHAGAWRRPNSRVEEKYDLALFRDVVTWAERAKLHAVFLADGLRLDLDTVSSQPFAGLEPVTLLSALAAVTEHIGLIGSISTTFSEPYNVARQLASLDHISGGRAGWNLVTSAWGEENFGRELPPHAERYERGAEFAEVLLKLFDSWGPGAVRIDRAAGVYADVGQVAPIDHVGKHFSVAGPLNVARSPQGRPIIAQAGSSGDGQAVAARFADLVFTTGRITHDDSIEFYRSVKSQVSAAGRDPRTVKVLPGVSPIIGETEAAARAVEKELNGLIDLESGRAKLSRQLGNAFLDDLELDEQIPAERLPAEEAVEGRRSRYGVYLTLIEDGWTLRRLIEWEVASSGHFVPVGAPEQIADLLLERFEARGADGFILLPSYLPEGLTLLTEAVIPILQERGAFQTEYAGQTLRENLGLNAQPAPVPA
ncbi:NtaA/DmoA family FMN-dependent monooxygenase [Gordonia sp. ABSL1-1]|uniref:NtaA/DmoA family FMN-dependent monooxygenase n=1 Tax=Gordonia sp. ABSL1-1 TaxID=3053923 RepID=UPI00257283B0|nr:NtaA/DmoA family FMN-dependent monooxygenase [Gordonia sp. ABSL1-1]MDL9937290.1 NtaA/DmoA family FMN-dependent monooxygenase [Gordonia sp. ABSL1-1]